MFRYESSQYRARQPAATSGPGVHIVSPQKRPSKRKTRQQAVSFLDLDNKRRRLQEELDNLLSSTPLNRLSTNEDPPINSSTSEITPDDHDTNWVDVAEVKANSVKPKVPRTRRTTPNDATLKLHAKWGALLPSLVEPLLTYLSRSTAKPLQATGDNLQGQCASPTHICDHRKTTVLCFYFDHFKSVSVEHCSCKHIGDTLVRNGLFPTAPSQVRMAVSIDFLDFYGALFEHSCDAVNAVAAALNKFYIRRGYYLLNCKNERYREPFRRSIGHAAQWLDSLQVLVEQHTESLLEQADTYLQMQYTSKHTATPPLPPPLFEPLPISTPSSAPVFEEKSPLDDLDTQMECARVLRQLCPACFGGATYGRHLEDGGDFQIATDGNFHHRHLTSGGASIPFHNPKHILPKEFVDAVGNRIQLARKTPSKSRTPKVPDSAVDECERSHEAADGEKKKSFSNEGRYDDMGWMSLVCRHDIPLFFANIDTPGEQQKYAIALILWFFELIPFTATATVLYDIGCVLDRSIQMYDILPSHMHSRIQLVTTAMHAYGHQWSCQLMYNPRLCKGLGLTDGEGVERTWSRLRKLIPLVRVSSRARRIWLTDRQLSAIAYDLRADLGDWLKRRQRMGIQEQAKKAMLVLNECGIHESILRSQWELQKASQLSIRAHAPARLKKELDTILNLQADLETVEKAIDKAKFTLTTTSAPKESKDILGKLYDMHHVFTTKVESLYISLNMHDSYPDLKGASLEFVRTLLMARDLKLNIRRRAIESFFEWDRLDQAVGGRSQALGTKLHQQTRKAISRRAPALITAIRKFNAYCSKLHSLNDPAWNIPIPLALPTKLSDLRDHSDLMEDVWISSSSMAPQSWLVDPNVRSGIRAIIKLDRCAEEERRLELEAANLSTWFCRELGAVELLLRTPTCDLYALQLQQYHNELLHLRSRWSDHTHLAAQFSSHVEQALLTASRLTGHSEPCLNRLTVQNQGQRNYDLDSADSDDDADIQLSEADNDIHDLPASEEAAEAIILSEMSPMENTDRDEGVDTSAWEHSESILRFEWNGQIKHLTKDIHLATFISQCAELFPRSGLYHLTCPIQTFDLSDKELQTLDTKDALLTDICINGLSALLHAIISRDPNHEATAHRCVIFSTYDLVWINYKAPDTELWRSTYRREYWTKDIWIVPIHRQREQHWVLAVFYFSRKEIYLYDSLARQSSWNRDIENLSIFLQRLVGLAKHKGYNMTMVPTDWVAKPVLVKPVQSNNHDCGLWVLIWISTVLRGHISAGDIDEAVIPSWRLALRNLVFLLSNSYT